MPTLLLTPSVMREGKSNRWREMLWPWIDLPALMEADLGMTEMGDPVCRWPTRGWRLFELNPDSCHVGVIPGRAGCLCWSAAWRLRGWHTNRAGRVGARGVCAEGPDRFGGHGGADRWACRGPRQRDWARGIGTHAGW